MVHVDCSSLGTEPEDCCGSKLGSKQHEVGPPHTTKSCAGGTKQQHQIPAWNLPQTLHKRQRNRDSFLTHLLQSHILEISFYDNKKAGTQVIWGFSQWDAPSLNTPEWWFCTDVPRNNASYWIPNISCNIWGLTNSLSCPPLLGALTRAHPHTVWPQQSSLLCLNWFIPGCSLNKLLLRGKQSLKIKMGFVSHIWFSPYWYFSFSFQKLVKGGINKIRNYPK